MISRIHILNLTAALVLAGSALAQQPTPAGGAGGQTQPSAGGAQGGAPQGAPPAYGGAQQETMDPYMADKDFVKNAAEVSATEVHLGKLAQEKASTDAVKQLGKQMVEANQHNGEQLKQAATALNVSLSDDPPKKAKKAEEKLAKLSGSEFDRAYAKIAADEQKNAVKHFERESKNGKVKGLKDFAAKGLPAEQERQKQAEELAGSGAQAAKEK